MACRRWNFFYCLHVSIVAVDDCSVVPSLVACWEFVLVRLGEVTGDGDRDGDADWVDDFALFPLAL